MLLLVAATAACGAADPVATASPGDPLPGLATNEIARFRAGQALFNKVFSPEEGLGPLFNGDQCSACHTVPAAGGTGEQLLVRASRSLPDGTCDPLLEEGGENIRVMATPLLQMHGIERQPIPPGATDLANFTVPFLFGLGLVEAIPEEEILSRADPNDRDGDGISGRPGRDAHGRLARFGRKAEHATLRDFVENAAHLEMGLTTPSRPDEGGIGREPFPPGTDPAPDPELNETAVALLTDFIRFLAPIAPRDGETPEDRRLISRGAVIFREIGCAQCHVPTMRTGPSSIAALDRKPVALYSDLLLHDMGPELANICTPGASRTELRTEPLMGLGRRSVYLHDGRARDLPTAIRFHGGEAAPARERFQALGELDQYALIRFLQSL